MLVPQSSLDSAYRQARADLLAERTAARHWVGQLSASALSTATAVSALALLGRQPATAVAEADRPRLPVRLEQGLRWLRDQQNPDGGWGDTDRSHSNISTTMLVRAAFALAGAEQEHAQLLARAERYTDRQGGPAGVRQRYGSDKTFAVPILTNAALAGLVSWQEVPALPFEAACVPQRLYRWLRLPVVSYAIPALVAIGQAVCHHRPPRLLPTRLVRRLASGPSRRVLARVQPASGGFLEAVPLTSFVVMSLVSIGQAEHAVTRAGTRFLLDSVRTDGSWPIDTNLATWTSTLALNALAGAGEPIVDQADLEWLLRCQHTERHPYTGAPPGGWGWTNLSGAVPDADDTAGALLALAHWHGATPQDADRRQIARAAEAGVGWLLDLQNRDGGWPTFCRGWGTLPFDRSGSDLTAHAVRALHAWRGLARRRCAAALRRGLAYLRTSQAADGSWSPLWFGNQHHPAEANPLYGTARVLLAYSDLEQLHRPAARRGLQWLTASQQSDGGWSGAPDGPPSVEETAVATEALAACLLAARAEDPLQRTALRKGVAWLVEAVRGNRHRESAPIGFYFAKLWYYERLYPLVFTVAALGRARRWMAEQPPSADEGYQS